VCIQHPSIGISQVFGPKFGISALRRFLELSLQGRHENKIPKPGSGADASDPRPQRIAAEEKEAARNSAPGREWTFEQHTHY
jgi:hypothetical protein